MRRINLYSLKQPAIIVKAETGLIYSNQTNGVACSHPQQEGFLVVLDPPPEGCRLFNPSWWYKEMPALNDPLYDELEAVLNHKYRHNWHVRDISVARKAKNTEAWVHITFRGDLEVGTMMGGGTFCKDVNDKPQPQNYPIYEGVLTWENCD